MTVRSICFRWRPGCAARPYRQADRPVGAACRRLRRLPPLARSRRRLCPPHLRHRRHRRSHHHRARSAPGAVAGRFGAARNRQRGLDRNTRRAGHLAALAAAQARPVGVPGDREGIVVAEAEARAPAAKLAIVRPLDGARGSVMSPARWQSLSNWSEQMRSWIIVDHTRCEIRGARDVADAAYNGNRVVQIGGFDGLMFPSLGCAWIVAPEGLVDPLLAMLRLWDEPVPMPTQATLAEYMGSPMHGLHLDRALAERSARLAAFQAGFDLGGGRLDQLLMPRGQGLRVMLPGVAKDRAVADACRAAGVGVQAISTRAAIGHESGLVAGFAGTPVKRTEAAAASWRGFCGRQTEPRTLGAISRRNDARRFGRRDESRLDGGDRRKMACRLCDETVAEKPRVRVANFAEKTRSVAAKERREPSARRACCRQLSRLVPSLLVIHRKAQSLRVNVCATAQASLGERT